MMKILIILSRNIRDSLKSVGRNFSLSIASISCITITLLVVSIAIILTFNVNEFAKNVEKDVTIVAFMDNKITPEEIDDVLEEIKQIDGIESYTYKSKTDISEEMILSSPDLAVILSDYTEEENPLQPTYQVKVKDIEQIQQIANKIAKIDLVKNVKYGEGMIEQLISMFDIVKKISIIIVAALILVTAFLIANTIKITIF